MLMLILITITLFIIISQLTKTQIKAILAKEEKRRKM